ncbi:MAG: hypothetical protein K2J73_10580 [Oscillospiraceae bacterium]|nr:hypothetical protein [Oscillospiraceae bacterium]
MKIKIAAALTSAAFTILLSSCTNTSPETLVEISEPTETTTVSPYLLVRGWDGGELLDSIFYCEKKRPLPLILDENPDLILSDGNLIFPDGSYAQATAITEDDRTVITALCFRRETAPADFSVYSVGFGARPDDIPDIVGIANRVYGSEETTFTHSFYDGGITELTFVFKEKVLSEIYIAS